MPTTAIAYAYYYITFSLGCCGCHPLSHSVGTGRRDPGNMVVVGVCATPWGPEKLKPVLDHIQQ